MELKEKKVAILGLGIEGIALAHFLRDRALEVTILDINTMDSLLKKADDPEFKSSLSGILADERFNKVLGQDYLDNLIDFDVIFRSPGIPFLKKEIQDAARCHGVRISSQIKLFFDLCPCPIIGVTGTKGKGTTSSLIYEILKSDKGMDKRIFLAGNIGKPAVSLLDDISENDYVILELSSFQVQDLDKSPHLAVITNLYSEHQDYHQDLSEYHNSKYNLLKYQTDKDLTVLNDKSAFDQDLIEQLKSQIFYFGEGKNNASLVEKASGVESVYLNIQGKKELICTKDDIKLIGDHNLYNIAAASLAASLLGVDTGVISNAVKNFLPLTHRLEPIAEIGGVRYINDSYATIPESTIAAIKSLPESKVLILGGSSKGSDFHELALEITKANVKAVFLIGNEGPAIGKALERVSFNGDMIFREKTENFSLSKLLSDVAQVAKSGDVVLLSPACASFGLFKNYKDRGEKFEQAVIEMKDKSYKGI